QQFLVGERTVDLGRVEERAAQFDRPVQRGHRFGLVGCTVAAAHAHAAEAERRDLQALAAECACVQAHQCSQAVDVERIKDSAATIPGPGPAARMVTCPLRATGLGVRPCGEEIAKLWLGYLFPASPYCAVGTM